MLPMQGAWVQSLVRELRSHMPYNSAKKKKLKKKWNKKKEFISLLWSLFFGLIGVSGLLDFTPSGGEEVQGCESYDEGLGEDCTATPHSS